MIVSICVINRHILWSRHCLSLDSAVVPIKDDADEKTMDFDSIKLIFRTEDLTQLEMSRLWLKLKSLRNQYS